VVLVSRLNYGVWAFSSREHTYIRTDNRVRRSPYSHKGNIGESDLLFFLTKHINESLTKNTSPPL